MLEISHLSSLTREDLALSITTRVYLEIQTRPRYRTSTSKILWMTLDQFMCSRWQWDLELYLNNSWTIRKISLIQRIKNRLTTLICYGLLSKHWLLSRLKITSQLTFSLRQSMCTLDWHPLTLACIREISTLGSCSRHTRMLRITVELLKNK